MKKYLLLILISFLFSNESFANNYMKSCQWPKTTADYTFDFDNKTITAVDNNTGKFFIYRIQSFNPDKIITEKSPWHKSDHVAFQYIFDVKNKTITSVRYKNKKGGYNKYDDSTFVVICSDVNINFEKH